MTEEVVCANFAHTTKHGAIAGKKQTKKATFYNLDVIISVGYRVKSTKIQQKKGNPIKFHSSIGKVLFPVFLGASSYRIMAYT